MATDVAMPGIDTSAIAATDDVIARNRVHIYASSVRNVDVQLVN